MNEKLNTIINKFGMPALAVAGTAVTALATGSNSVGIAALPLTIATNLLSNKLTGLTEFELVNRLKNVTPEDLNHDIFRVSKSAVKLALKATIDEYDIDKDTRKKLKKKVDEICKQLEDKGVLNGITVKDIIDYENNLSENALKWSNTFSDELKEANVIFKDTDFDKIFQSYFHLYFGEYLKQDRPAYIAYEREMQKMIFNAVNELKVSLDSQNINNTIRESIAQYIQEIPTMAVNSEIQEEIKQEFQELKKYFESKEIIIITKINADKVHFEGYPPIDKNYEQIQNFLDGKYQFKYNGNTYYVDELNQETFDYLAGKIKYNQLFTKRIIESIKSDCEQQYPEFYNRIKKKGSLWDTTSLCEEGQEKISENFAGIIGVQLYELFGIGKEQSTEKNIKYIKKCRYIVKRTLDLIIFAFLSQLWDDLCSEKINLSDGDSLSDYFPIKEKHITLLRNLIRIYSEQKTDDTVLLIPDILRIADQFNENGELYIAYSQLEKLGDNPTILDCYFAEKHLTAFFEYFSFLVSYKLVSMKKIECFNIKNIGTDYLHHHDNLGLGDDKKATEEKIQKRNYHICCEKVNSMFTYALLLYKGDDYTQNINLFPFVIDINALNFEPISRIAFFRKSILDKPRLQYAYLLTGKGKDDDKYFELEHKGIEQQKEKNNVIFLTDDEMKIYNKDRVYTTFKEIEKQLFI